MGAFLHTIKIERRYYDRISDEQKHFEVRKNDRDYQVGDCIRFVVMDCGSVIEYAGRQRLWDIIYIHHGLGMQEGYIILGIKEDKKISKK